MGTFWAIDNPTPLGKPVYLRWLMTEYCNYRCTYCFFENHSRDHRYPVPVTRRDILRNPLKLLKLIKDKRRNSCHAFTNFSPSRWADAFERFFPQQVVLSITDGEPFLDRTNFRALLLRLTAMKHVVHIRTDTNGTWNPLFFEGVDWRKISLNLSYHPSMIPLEMFTKAVKEKLDRGVQIGMVNYVLAPLQLSFFEKIKDAMVPLGVFVNANVYVGPMTQTEKGYALYKKYTPLIDVTLRTNEIHSTGELCMYPALAYDLNPMGYANVGCFPRINGDFIASRLPERFSDRVPCPATACNCGCLDKYAFLKQVGRGVKMDLLEEYVEACRLHRGEYVVSRTGEGSHAA